MKLVRLLLSFILLSVCIPLMSRALPANAAAPTISGFVAEDITIAPYDKFQGTFTVATVATVPDFPYNASPPAGVPAGVGISVDGLFSNDGFVTTHTVPAFIFQDYTYSDQEGYDNFDPTGAQKWAVRYTPTTAGTWAWKIRAQDSGGTTTTSAGTFSVSGSSSNVYRRKGFVKVSSTDPRYFEFDDGSFFPGLGYNSSFDRKTVVDTKLSTLNSNGVDFLRVWMSGAGINGSQWTSWAWHGQPYNYLPEPALTTTLTFNNSDVVLLGATSGPACLFTDFPQGKVPVVPSTAYSVTARLRYDGVVGTGLTMKVSDWLGGTACAQPGTISGGVGANGTLAGPFTGTSSGYITVTGRFTTTSTQHRANYLYFALENTSAGTFRLDEAKMWKVADTNRVNILREPNANAHMFFDPQNSFQWDQFIESAEANGVYLKLVIDEKNEWIRNHILASGAITTTESNSNFYSQPNTKVRFLQEAWWRYVVARWGYSTAIHSFELINEGDPFDGNHHALADAMADYIHSVYPARMVTTSFYHSFPGSQYWGNSTTNYTDLHAYITSGWGENAAAFLPSSTWLEQRPNFVRRGNGAVKIIGSNNNYFQMFPNGIAVKGAGEWTVRYWAKAAAFSSSCAKQRVRWELDDGTFNGGREGSAPLNQAGQVWNCTSATGTYDWTQFDSSHDKDGVPISTTYRLILNDNNTHKLMLFIENENGTSGTAWFDDVEVVSPDGRVSKILGTFDTTSMREDTALYAKDYAETYGAKSNLSVSKPFVRGESGVDVNNTGSYDPNLLSDTAGWWLHNQLWAELGPGGIYDLPWWASETIEVPNLYSVYRPLSLFLAGIPINNGLYGDAQAVVNTPQIRVMGQRDDANDRAHLWISNPMHTWKNVVDNKPMLPVSGTVYLRGWPVGNARVEWWNTNSGTITTVQTKTVDGDGILAMPLTGTVMTDVAVKVCPAIGGAC